MAFYPELERTLNPQLYPKQILPNKLEPATLAELAQQRVPNSRVNAVLMEANQKATLVITGSRPGGKEQSNKLDFGQMIVDPYSGEELGRRQFGAISQGMINFMPFIYKLYYNLTLDSAGMRVLGICALIWIIDCFTGFYLTWPQQCKTRISSIDTSREAVNRNWWQRWQRWQPVWKVRLNSGGYKLNSRQATSEACPGYFSMPIAVNSNCCCYRAVNMPAIPSPTGSMPCIWPMFSACLIAFLCVSQASLSPCCPSPAL